MSSFLNIAFYKFVPLENLDELHARFRPFCTSLGIKGTILLASEGINGSLAGEPEAIQSFRALLEGDLRFAGMIYKESFSDFQPFDKMAIKIKKEIVTMRTEGIDPVCNPAPTIAPEELKRWYEEKKEFVIIDTRNDYEYNLGTFENAVAIGVDNFRDFPAKVAELPEEWKSKPVVTFCTGGIRCEKAAPYMQSQGFANIYQLEGGILNYFKEVGGDHWKGECFVFDNRIAIDTKLQPTGARLCPNCQAPLTNSQGPVCPYCP